MDFVKKADMCISACCQIDDETEIEYEYSFGNRRLRLCR